MNNLFDDTIVGIATTVNNGAVSIIRLSGNESINIVNKIFKGKDLSKVESHTIHYGHIVDFQTKETIDEVLVSVFKSPKSYTTEDVVEINCHGGIFVTNQVLKQVVTQGARIAEAGEFTKRAFLNGRIDLTKAEAVMDMISCNSVNSLKIANSGLRGDIKELIESLKEQILNIIATINVNIDYPEYDDVEQLTNEIIYPRINKLIIEIKEIIDKSSSATLLQKGINTVIVGKPNVGKSSLLNLLLNESKAIVTDIPGTTRDVVEGQVNLAGVVLNLVDTAGIRETDDLIEKIGVEKSINKVEEADLILFVFDGSKELDELDKYLIKRLENKKYLKIINKSDLELKIEKEITKDALLISTFNHSSIKQIEDKIVEFLNLENISQNLNGVITNARQIGKLKSAYDELLEAKETIKNNPYIDFVELPLKRAWKNLQEIIGEASDDDLLNELFSKFCLGK